MSDENSLVQLRLLQILSPAAPVGSYSYSQGLEWAVHHGWVNTEGDFSLWIKEQIDSVLVLQDLPLLLRLYRASLQEDVSAVKYWSEFAVAIRDTAELRQEESDRANAYWRILNKIDCVADPWSKKLFVNSPLTSIAWFCAKHGVSDSLLLTSYAHNWLESHLLTGIKIIPLGQSSGQRLLFDFAPLLESATKASFEVGEDRIGISLPALSMASCAHETQYSRVYRS